jgi:hypothetical protein
MSTATALVLDERMLAHDPGRGNPERPSGSACCSTTSRTRAILVRLGPRTGDRRSRIRAAYNARGHIEQAAATAGRARVVFDPDTSDARPGRT